MFNGYLNITVKSFYKIAYDIELKYGSMPLVAGQTETGEIMYYPIEILDICWEKEDGENIPVETIKKIEWKTNIWNGRLRFR